MADLIEASKPQSLDEVKQYDIDYTNDLLTGVTVSSAEATHIPPSGSPTSPTVGAISENVVPVTLGPLTQLGIHFLSVLATYSNGEKSEVRIKIRVNF